MASRIRLCDLPGEIQDHIILSLHPSAAVALARTNHHFHATASLTRLSSEAINAFLEERKIQIRDATDYLCCTCFVLKPWRAFTKAHVKGPRSKTGKDANKRSCFKCLLANGRVLPGNVVDMADARLGMRVYCFACLSLRERFCVKCNWCSECARQRKVKTFRQGWKARDGSGDGMGVVVNCCAGHQWSEVVKVVSVEPWEEEDGYGSN